MPGRVFPIEVQFISKKVYDLEAQAQTHTDYESLRQNFSAEMVYKNRGIDYFALFEEIADLETVLPRYFE